MINNFSTYGRLGISKDVIAEIAKQAVKEVEGVSISRLPINNLTKSCCEVNLKKNGGLLIKLGIDVHYGYNVNQIVKRVQERIEHNLLYMTEIKPNKINVIVSEIA